MSILIAVSDIVDGIIATMVVMAILASIFYLHYCIISYIQINIHTIIITIVNYYCCYLLIYIRLSLLLLLYLL